MIRARGVSSLGSAVAASVERYHLGEGPVWDAAREILMWVDIDAAQVWEGKIDAHGRIQPLRSFGVPEVAASVSVGAVGDWIVAGRDRVWVRANDGTLAAGALFPLRPDQRLNDGKPDPAGRLVIGTKGDGPEQLFRLEPDGRVLVLDDDLSLSNGLGWDRAGTTFYSIDTFRRRVYARSYDPATGAVGVRRVLVEFAAGYPDGMTVDDEDHLWIALWGEGAVVRVAPSGRVVGRLDVDAPQPTCPVFAGPALDVLVVTTATEGLTTTRLADAPSSGRLFTARTGHRGAAPSLWSGEPTAPRKESS